jgi:hypothetical protein
MGLITTSSVHGSLAGFQDETHQPQYSWKTSSWKFLALATPPSAVPILTLPAVMAKSSPVLQALQAEALDSTSHFALYTLDSWQRLSI